MVEVTTRRRVGRSRPGIAARHSTTLAVADVHPVRGIPCTSVARTLLDLAAILDRRGVERALDRAETLREFDLRSIEDLLARSRRARGAAVLRSALSAYGGTTTLQSKAEERFLALLEAGGIERPRVNEWMALAEGGGYRPDFLWPLQRLVVEIDGRAYHARRRAFRHDRQRDRRLALAGYETRRYDASEVIQEPQRVLDELRAFLAARAP